MKKPKQITIRIGNLKRSLEVEPFSSLFEIGSLLKEELGFTPISATIDHRVASMDDLLYDNCDVTFFGMDYEQASYIYFRTVFMILSRAVSELFPGKNLIAEHSISRGYYVTLSDSDKLTKETVQALKSKADEIIKSDLPIQKKRIPTEEALSLLRSRDRAPLIDLLKTSGRLYTTIYSIGDYIDCYEGVLLTHTGAIYLYDIIPYFNGILIRVPDRKDPSQLAPMVLQKKMQNVIKEQDRLLAMLRLSWVGSVNKAILAGKAKNIIQVSEAFQEKQIAAIADHITDRYQEGVRLVLISGPSSSGKTTFTNRLRTQLLTNFIRPHMISLDDYFVEKEFSPRDEEGNYDFESLYALDLNLFNSDMKRLLAGETIELPTYDFRTGKRVYKEGNTLTLRDGDVLMLEGIHALNPELLPSISTSKMHKVYVSALTALGIDEHNTIPTTTHRLLRRIIRDNSFRGYSAKDTIATWSSVRRGEDKWVFPYQENADDMFNSSMVYELAAIRPIAEPLLLEVPESVPEYAEAQRLLSLLRFNRNIPQTEIPKSSLLREFVGGSLFYS